ncbi:MAG: hypothetical protein ACXWV4_07140, partial [Flavitalea sp.]
LRSSNARNKESNANGKAGKSGIEELNSEGVKNNSETVSGGRVQNSEGTSKTISGKGVQQSEGTSEIISGKGVQQFKGTSEIISGARQNKLSSISAKNQNNKNKPSPFEKSNPGSSISLQDKNNNQVVVEKNIQENQPINEIPEVDFIKQTSLPIIQHQHSPIDIYVSTHADSMIAKLANVAIPERDTSVKSNTIFPFEVGMLVGSDMSNVNFQGNERMGLNFGIYVGYRINKRWLINTGLIHDKKYYSARGKDFHPPKGYWTDYVKLDLVAGNCSMWEIPLNVRYDLSLIRKGSWFLSGGLSTYLMQQEDYDYHYWTNGNFYTRHKGYPSSEKNILSIINLSGGFEKNFTPHVSLQIEPYMRIPLKGIGFGNMQMNSFGTNFILKFKSGPAKK